MRLRIAAALVTAGVACSNAAAQNSAGNAECSRALMYDQVQIKVRAKVTQTMQERFPPLSETSFDRPTSECRGTFSGYVDFPGSTGETVRMRYLARTAQKGDIASAVVFRLEPY